MASSVLKRHNKVIPVHKRSVNVIAIQDIDDDDSMNIDPPYHHDTGDGCTQLPIDNPSVMDSINQERQERQYQLLAVADQLHELKRSPDYLANRISLRSVLYIN